MSTIPLSLAKPGKAMPGPYSSLMVLRRRASRGAVPDGRSVGQNRGSRRRSDSTFYFKQRQSHAPQRGACDCQERIRQLVVFTPGSCAPQPGQTLVHDSKVGSSARRVRLDRRRSRQRTATIGVFGFATPSKACAMRSPASSEHACPTSGLLCGRLLVALAESVLRPGGWENMCRL